MGHCIEHMPHIYPYQAAEDWDNYTQFLFEGLLLGCELISRYFQPALQADRIIFIM